MYEHPAVFMSMLRDERGEPLAVEPFHEEWLGLFQCNDRVAVLAPRGHGKTTCVIAYLLWCCWRHNRRPDTGLLLADLPEGTWEAIIFSARMEQATHLFETFQSLMLANEELFADILPVPAASGRASVRDVWSRKMTRLRNRAQVSIRAYGTSTRGLHPDLLLLDDVLCDENSLSSYQRDQTWRYFTGTVLPMNPAKLIVIGTAFHYGDLLHRLEPKDGTKSASGRSKVRFTWRKFAAIDTDKETALWEARHPYEELLERRDFDPVSFAREFMNEPTDDASSLFPFELTERMVDPTATFAMTELRPDLRDEYIVFGYDLAASAEVRADYCCLIVIALHKQTRRRRVLWAYRERGLGYDTQVELLRDVCRRYGGAIGVVETNGFQRWIKDACDRFPETANRIFGHTTGRDKGSLEDGMPVLKLGIKGGEWDGALPAGDDESTTFTSILRTEAAAFGWKDGKLQGVGEHDDTVMALWLANIAARMVEDVLLQEPEYEIVTMEELGIERVKIGPDI
jgi:hypothetical protein